MCLTGTLLRSVLVVLLLADACGKRGCNYKGILGSYSRVILVELHNLKLTGSLNSSKVRDPCPSGKSRGILVSIYGMTQQTRCQRSSNHTSDLERALENMEQLITQNCRPGGLGKKVSCSAVQKIRGKKRKRMRLIKVIQSLITCWQKLQSVSLLSK